VATFDLLLRAATFTLAFAVAVAILLRPGRRRAHAYAAFAVGGIGAFMVASAPGAHQALGLGAFFFNAWCITTPAVVWMLALVLFRTPVTAPVWAAVALSLVGLALISGMPEGSAAGNALVLANAVAQSFQIVAMERFAPRYDARALTFLQMSVACAGFAVIQVG